MANPSTTFSPLRGDAFTASLGPGSKRAGCKNTTQQRSTRFSPLTVLPILEVEGVPMETVARELARVYFLHPQAKDFQVEEDDSLGSVCGKLLARMYELIPDGYAIGFTEVSEDDPDLKIALLGEIEHQELSMVQGSQVVALKKQNPQLYFYLCRVLGKLLKGGLPDTTDFCFFDSAVEEELASEHEEQTKAEIKKAVRAKEKIWKSAKKVLDDFVKECCKQVKLQPAKPQTKDQEIQKLLDLAESLLESPFNMNDFLETVHPKGSGGSELEPDQFIFLGWDTENPLDESHLEHIDCYAREGVLNPYHIVILEDSTSWNKVENVDFGFLSRYSSLADQLTRISGNNN